MYALARRTPSFHPTEIHVITTAEGESRTRLELLDPRRSQLNKLCKQYRLPLPLCDASTIHVIKQAGQVVTDLRGAADNAAAADCILDVVRLLTADGQSQIHFSIAGGRKTMGFYLGYCASLLGRVQDEMSHVLINPEFENLPAFFFPPKPPEVIIDRNNKPHDTVNAEVDMAPVAFWRLRTQLPNDLLQTGRSFSETVLRLNALQGKPSLTLRLLPPKRTNAAAGYQALAAGYEVRLTRKGFALLWMFARLAKSPRESDRSLIAKNWLASYDRIALAVYGAITGKGQIYDKAVAVKGKSSGRTSIPRNEVDKLNKLLRESLGTTADKIYGITVTGRNEGPRNENASYTLSLPPSAITLEDVGRLADQT